jgi:hypothetical protein
MARVVLHMGTHKTATTTLQDSFHANRALLAQHGVIYPALGRHTGHHGVLTDWIALSGAYQLPEGGIGTLRSLAAEHVDSDVTLFLSSEEFSRAGGQGGHVDMAALRAIFDGFESITVLCCLRPQWQFLQSVYLEVARDRRPLAPPKIVETALATHQVDGLWCEFGALYDHLRSGFAAHEIRLLNFDVLKGHPNGIIGAMLDEIDVSLAASDLAQMSVGHSNVSPKPLPVWAALALLSGGIAQEGPKGHALVEAMTTAVDLEYGAGRSSSIFTRDEQSRLAVYFGPLNANLVARVCDHQPEFYLTNTPPASDALYREDLGSAFWVRAARRIYMMHSVSR